MAKGFEFLSDILYLGVLGVGGYVVYTNKDAIWSAIQNLLKPGTGGGGGGGGGCTNTCTAPKVLNTACQCVNPPAGCTKTCTAPQVLNTATCTCETPSGGGGNGGGTGGGGGGGTTSFTAVGDAGTGRHAEPSVGITKAMIAKHPNAILGCGDYAYTGGAGGFAPVINLIKASNIPALWSKGNHDANDILTATGQKGWVFRTDIGNCTFVSLDGNSFGGAPAALDGLLAKTPPKKWKIVFFHQPIVSPSSTHGQAKDPGVKAVFKKYGVQLCIQAHNHIYARTASMNGTTYVVQGTWGESHYTGGTANGAVKIDVKNFGFGYCVAGASSMDYKFISAGGSVIDSFSIT